MFSRSDFNQLVKAVETRDALAQARSRREGEVIENYSSDPTVSTDVFGTRYRPPIADSKLPLYDQSDKPFMSEIVGKNKAFALPADIKEGNLLEYQDVTTGEKYYGKVVQTNSSAKQIKVEHISRVKAEEEMQANPRTKVYELRQEDITPHHGRSIMRLLMSMLDPSENVLFKLLTLLLVGNLFKSESVTDIFVGIYLRVLAFAVAVIGAMYLSTLVLN